jgi:hypothetical protein
MSLPIFLFKIDKNRNVAANVAPQHHNVFIFSSDATDIVRLPSGLSRELFNCDLEKPETDKTLTKLSWTKVIEKFSRLSCELFYKAEHFDFYAPVEVAQKFNLI